MYIIINNKNKEYIVNYFQFENKFRLALSTNIDNAKKFENYRNAMHYITNLRNKEIEIGPEFEVINFMQV